MTATTETSTHGYVGHPELPHGYDPYIASGTEACDDWMATAAVVCGAVLLFPLAIVLGHLAVRAAHDGSARERRRSIVALALGYGGATLALITSVAWALLEVADPEVVALLAH